jgi:hypothetical protein
MCKEMPVIPIKRGGDMKRTIGKNGGPRRRRGTGIADPNKSDTTLSNLQ